MSGLYQVQLRGRRVSRQREYLVIKLKRKIFNYLLISSVVALFFAFFFSDTWVIYVLIAVVFLAKLLAFLTYYTYLDLVYLKLSRKFNPHHRRHRKLS